jgi:hypothetical protein
LIPEGTGVVRPPIVHLVAGLSNICPIYERKAALHSQKSQLLLLRCGYISWNWETW